MNLHYYRRYEKFIRACENRVLKFGIYTETHHIIPRSLGGTDNIHNLIVLSGREHFIAHYILARAYNNQKMIKAFHRMMFGTVKTQNIKYTNRTYEWLRKEHIKYVSEYSKNTVTCTDLLGKTKRISKELFNQHKNVLYFAVAKGREYSESDRLKKSIANLGKNTTDRISKENRSYNASEYMFRTPLTNNWVTSKELQKFYPSFTLASSQNLRKFIDNDKIISAWFVRDHPEFKEFLGKKFSELEFLYKKK